MSCSSLTSKILIWFFLCQVYFLFVLDRIHSFPLSIKNFLLDKQSKIKSKLKVWNFKVRGNERNRLWGGSQEQLPSELLSASRSMTGPIGIL